MVRFIIEIEQVAGKPKAVNVVVRTEKQQSTHIEEAVANRLAPSIRALPSASLSDDLSSE